MHEAEPLPNLFPGNGRVIGCDRLYSVPLSRNICTTTSVRRFCNTRKPCILCPAHTVVDHADFSNSPNTRLQPIGLDFEPRSAVSLIHECWDHTPRHVLRLQSGIRYSMTVTTQKKEIAVVAPDRDGSLRVSPPVRCRFRAFPCDSGAKA